MQNSTQERTSRGIIAETIDFKSCNDRRLAHPVNLNGSKRFTMIFGKNWKIFPTICLVCHQSADHTQTLCQVCYQHLALQPPNRCLICAIDISPHQHPDDPGLRCGNCIQDPPFFDRCVAATSYNPVAGKLINQLKHNRQLAASVDLSLIHI